MEKKFRSVGITSTASCLPERVVTNQDIVDMGTDTSVEWIKKNTGISTRRWVKENETTSGLGSIAAEKCLEKANLAANDVDLILVATSTPDTIVPSTACYIQYNIGASKAGAVDVNNACSGFNYALAMGSKFVADSTYDNVLVIGAELPSKFLNTKERTPMVFFGDGAGAFLLQEVEQGYGFMASYLRADGSGADKLSVPAGGSSIPINAENIGKIKEIIHMDGKGIWDFAIGAIPDAITNCAARADLEADDVDFFIFHQANYNIIKEGMKSLGFPMSKTFLNIEKFGNTISASQPIAFNEALEKKLVKRDDTIMFVGYGAGLSWGANLVKWH